VLDFSKIEAGRLQLDPVDCDLIECSNKRLKCWPRARQPRHRAALRFTGGCAAAIKLDAVRLRQVLVNLGGNAVKFTERGEVILRLELLARNRVLSNCALPWPIPVWESRRKIRPEYSRNSRKKMPRRRADSAAPVFGLAISRKSSN